MYLNRSLSYIPTLTVFSNGSRFSGMTVLSITLKAYGTKSSSKSV